MAKRAPLTRDAIVAAGIGLADRDGLARLSMRSLATALGVEAMSLYHHVRDKDDLLDGMVDVVFGLMHLPEVGGDWRDQMRARAESAREVLKAHPWALGLVDSRSHPGPATLVHHDAVLGCLRAGGFSVPMAGHAFALLDAHLYGFVTQELALPFDDGDDLAAVAADVGAAMPVDVLPHLAEFMHHALRPGYRFGAEFGYGLELILEALEARRTGGDAPRR